MTFENFKSSFLASMFVSLLLSPAMLVFVILYSMFSGNTGLFLFQTVETIETTREESTSFSFEIKPTFFLIVFGIFVLTFAISMLLKLFKSNRQT